MKKQIDPNLNGLDEMDFLFQSAKNDEKDSKATFSEPSFKVTENDIADQQKEYHHHHHHHSSENENSENSDETQQEKLKPSAPKGTLNGAFIGEDERQKHYRSHSSGSSSHHSHSSGSSSHHHHSSSGHSHSKSKSHSKHSKKHKKSKLSPVVKAIIIIISIILAVALIAAITFFVLEQSGKKDIQPVENKEAPYQETIKYNGHTYAFDKDVVAIAFLGIDQRDLSTSDKDFLGCSDADILVTIDTSDKKVRVIAVPRDTMVDVDLYSESGIFLHTEKMQLCLSYAYGDGGTKSCENVINSMSRILYNAPIQKYFALDLDGIAPLNDAVGGVKVKSLYDFSKLGIKQGDVITLKGDMAEEYVRTRDMDNINASLNRTQRQVQYVQAYAQALAPAVTHDFGVVSDLYKTSQQYSNTNLTLNNVTYLASILASNGVKDFETYSIEGTMKEAKTTVFPDAVYAEFYPDDDSVMNAVLTSFYDQID